ncbi:MAG: hypothetical protein ABIT76_02590 [Chthoniobacterales bacterium]
MIRHTKVWLLLGASLLTSVAHAADTVSRAEYEALKKQVAVLQKQIATRDTVETPASTSTTSSSAIASLQRDVTDLKSAAELTRPGTTNMHIAGSMSTTFSTYANDNSNFSAKFSPIFIWEITDRLLFEGEVEMELENSDTVVKVEYAQMSYLLNDYLTLGVGKFLSPLNNFVERYEPGWINKLPDTPLAIYDGILPESHIGAQIRGVIPLGVSRVNFAAYVANAPRLIANDPEALGQLQFDNFSSLSNDKAVGGRIGFEPLPWLEVGYGAQVSDVSDADGLVGSPRALLQSVDLRVKRDSPFFKGGFTLLGQYAWTDVGRETYDADGSLGVGPVTFDNKRSGGYLQLSYRPKQLSEFLNHFEAVVRADEVNAPSDAPGAFDEKRLTVGLNYYLLSATVVKAAYELDERNNGEPNQNGFLLQFSSGF